MAAHDGLDGLRGLVGVVEGDRADVVVQHVRLDDAVQERAAHEPELAVDGGRGAAHVVPASGRVVGERGVGVLEVGDGNWGFVRFLFCVGNERGVGGVRTEPVVHPEVGEEVPDEHVLEAVGLAERDQDGDGDGEAEITQEDEFGVLGFIQGAGWVEVVDASEVAVDLALSTTFELTLVVVVASDVGEKVHWPSKELLAD